MWHSLTDRVRRLLQAVVSREGSLRVHRAEEPESTRTTVRAAGQAAGRHLQGAPGSREEAAAPLPHAAPELTAQTGVQKPDQEKRGVTALRLSPLTLHLGIDFGTRFTKVCFRDLGREQSEVVAFAPLGVVSLDEALLPSRVDVRDGLVYGGLTENEWKTLAPPSTSTVVDFLKIRLAQLDVEEMGSRWPFAEIGELAAPETIEALTAFYLARVIDRSRRWIAAERRELLVGRQPLWSVSVGVPVQYCDSPALARFGRVLRLGLAWADAGVGTTIRSEELVPTAAPLERVAAEGECFVVAELGAAVRPFVASPQAPEGVYVYLDVGAGTLDGVSFGYLREDGRPRLVCHSARVEPLGVSAIAGRLAPVVRLQAEEVERALSKMEPGDDLPADVLNEPRRLIRRVLAGVLMEGKRKDPRGWTRGVEDLARAFYLRVAESSRAGRFPLFVGGGGSLSHFYREAIESTYGTHNLVGANIRPYRVESVPVPRDLQMHGIAPEHFHRFAVAYGLSVPPGESGHLDLPSETAAAPPPPRTPPPVTSYEDLP